MTFTTIIPDFMNEVSIWIFEKRFKLKEGVGLRVLKTYLPEKSRKKSENRIVNIVNTGGNMIKDATGGSFQWFHTHTENISKVFGYGGRR